MFVYILDITCLVTLKYMLLILQYNLDSVELIAKLTWTQNNSTNLDLLNNLDHHHQEDKQRRSEIKEEAFSKAN